MINYNNSSYDIEPEYYPEYYLSKNLNTDVYIITNEVNTINDILKGYMYLLNKFSPTSIYLFDGGCDSFLSGDESGLGTPLEDMMHMKAIESLPFTHKYLCAIGANVDTGHGVYEHELLQRIINLENNKIILKKEIWDIDNVYVKEYYQIVQKSNPKNSIVHSLICASLDGKEGFHIPANLSERISESIVYLSNLTKTFLIFDFNRLIETIKYFNMLCVNMTQTELDYVIEEYHTMKNCTNNIISS